MSLLELCPCALTAAFATTVAIFVLDRDFLLKAVKPIDKEGGEEDQGEAWVKKVVVQQRLIQRRNQAIRRSEVFGVDEWVWGGITLGGERHISTDLRKMGLFLKRIPFCMRSRNS